MPKENDCSTTNVFQIIDGAPMPKMRLPKAPLQNVPTARELVQREHLSRLNPSPNSDLFEAVFNQLDDDTFWEIINLIEGCGFSFYHDESGKRTVREDLKETKPISDRS